VYANKVLKCSTQDSAANSVPISYHYLTATNSLFILVLSISIATVSYYVVSRVRRARMLKSRYSGTIVKSMTKYKLAKLDDYSGDTQTGHDVA
jgi:hypothetical protein